MGSNRESNSKIEKGFWEYLGAISGVLIALVGLWATHVYKQKQVDLQEIQVDLQEIQAVRSFFKHLLSENLKEQELAAIALKELTNKELAARLIEVAITSEDRKAVVIAKFGTQEVLNIMEQKNNPFEIRDTARKAFDKISAAKVFPISPVEIEKRKLQPVIEGTQVRKTGWVYLGSYLADDNFWETRYLNFKTDSDPQSFVGVKLGVRQETGTLNVRSSIPDESAKFGQVIDALEPGTELKILEVQPWSSTSYTWAHIEY